MNLLPPPRPPNLSPPKPLLPPSTPQEKLLELSLQLVLCSFSYDFIGATLDEASEELGTIQVPSSWRGTMEEPSKIDTLKFNSADVLEKVMLRGTFVGRCTILLAQRVGC